MKPFSILRVFAILAQIFTTTAYAILDTNNNYLSDIFERQYNNDNLFVPTILAENDEDKDGWTNAQEAAAGTNPFDPNPPDGIVTVTITPSLTEGAFTLTWPTLIGKNYQLKASTDLITWSNVGGPVISYHNSNLNFGVNIAQPNNTTPPKIFWTVSVEDRDEDDDRLTAAEEYALGLDDFIDENIAGIPDYMLALNFIDDLLTNGISGVDLEADNDGDGRTNREELLDETNPNVNDEPSGVKWVVVVGNQAMGVASTRTKLLEIPAGKTVLLTVVIASEEYTNGYTIPDETEQFDDLLTWNVEPSGQQAITGQININDRHDELVLAEINFQKLWGLPGPIHYEVVKVLTAPTTADMTVDVEISATNIADNIYPSYVAVGILPIDLKVTDFATKYDSVPYVAISNALPPKNSELYLKADQTNEKAKIEITHPSIIDEPLLSKLKWKVINKVTESTVGEGNFANTTTPEVELSLVNESSVEDEILFEVQIGANEGTFTPAAKMNVLVVRDRLNWLFEPFSADFGWRTAKPEPREDTGDYKRKQITNAAGKLEWVPDPTHPNHHPNAYKRECLQSLYAFFKDNAPGIPPNFGSTSADAGQAKTRSWLRSDITCFSEFHDKLKTPNHNQLVDLNSITPLKLNFALDLEGTAGRSNLQKILKHLIEKQTKVTVSSLPLLNYTNPKGTWAKNAATQLGDARIAYYDLLAFWQKEGSMNVRSSPELTGAFPAFEAPAPVTEDEAKVIFIAKVFWQNFGMDSLNPHLGAESDNRPDLSNLASAITHIQNQVDRLLGNGQGVIYFATLGATASEPGIYAITSGETFYTFTLKLLGRMILTDYWRSEGIVATYCSYNMGIVNFNQMVASLSSAIYPERARLGLEDWGWHYEVRVDEWANGPIHWPLNKPGIRPNATRFWYFRETFKNLTTP